MAITILDANLKFTNSTGIRKNTDAIILHHSGTVSATVQAIHNYHINTNGWAGFGYHFLVRKNGEIWRGRPEGWIGAHAGTSNGYNSHSIGICFEGEYEYADKTMPNAQYNAGVELIKYLLGKYPNSRILQHKDVSPSTDCAGRYFPIDKFKAITLNKVQTQLQKDIDVLNRKGIMASPQYWDTNLQVGKDVREDYVIGLIHNMAEYIKSHGTP